jgi:hypothetical protein
MLLTLSDFVAAPVALDTARASMAADLGKDVVSSHDVVLAPGEEASVVFLYSHACRAPLTLSLSVSPKRLNEMCVPVAFSVYTQHICTPPCNSAAMHSLNLDGCLHPLLVSVVLQRCPE